MHRTGAVHGEPNQLRNVISANQVGQWNQFEIRVVAQAYTVFLNGVQVTQFTNLDSHRGRASAPGAPSFIGLQSYAGKRVAFRNIRFKAL